MSEMTSRRAETEGRRGSRIDTDEGDRYVGIPLNGQCSVQETGCGTDDRKLDLAAAHYRQATPGGIFPGSQADSTCCLRR